MVYKPATGESNEHLMSMWPLNDDANLNNTRSTNIKSLWTSQIYDNNLGRKEQKP